MSFIIPDQPFGLLKTSLITYLRIIILFLFLNLCISYCWFSKINKLKKPSCTFEALTDLYLPYKKACHGNQQGREAYLKMFIKIDHRTYISAQYN